LTITYPLRFVGKAPARGALPFYDPIDKTNYLTWLHMTFGLQFRIDQLSIDRDLEAAAIRWNEGYALDHMLELLEQVICQAYGPVGVVSDRTVDDLDSKHDPSQNDARGTFSNFEPFQP
jgi:hypothetical protein